MSMHAAIHRSRRQRGVTLIELMIALLLGLLLTAGIIQVFIGNRQTYEFTEGLSRIQESGRLALDLLSYRTRMAGYMGCLSDVEVFNNLDVSASDPVFNLGQGIEGFEASGTAPDDTINLPAGSGHAVAGLPTALSGGTNPPLPGSDVLVIRNVSVESTALVPPYQQSAGVFTDAEVGLYQRGDVLVVSDCQKASLFQVADNPNQSQQGTGIRVNHSQGSVTPGNAQPTVWPSNQQYGDGAEMMRMETWAFYIGQGAAGPALFQRRLAVTGTTAGLVSEELVEGVENMQILYGVDLNGNDAVDEYRTANNVADWDDVVSVRIALLARAPEEYGTETDTREYLLNGTTVSAPGDRRLRQAFTTTIALRNKLP